MLLKRKVKRNTVSATVVVSYGGSKGGMLLLTNVAKQCVTFSKMYLLKRTFWDSSIQKMMIHNIKSFSTK